LAPYLLLVLESGVGDRRRRLALLPLALEEELDGVEVLAALVQCDEEEALGIDFTNQFFYRQKQLKRWT
jgi:hypothetical protein